MPEMHFLVRWPDGRETPCTSPSLEVANCLAPGARSPVAAIVQRSGEALAIAFERVR